MLPGLQCTCQSGTNRVSFPNPKTCRELDRLKKEVEALQEKCQECHSKNPGGDHSSEDSRQPWDRLDQFMSHQKKDHAKVQEIQQALDVTRDELLRGRCTFNNNHNSHFKPKEIKMWGESTSEPNHGVDCKGQ